MNPTLLRVTQRIIERSKETRSAYLAGLNRQRAAPSTDLSWPAGTWRTASPPVSLMIKRR